MTEHRIAEYNRKFWIERRISGAWIIRDERDGVPKYFDSLADARSWVATIKRGVVYHDAEDAGRQWFVDRVGKMIRHRGHTFKITDNPHANRLYDASVLFGHEYTDPLEDAPNLAQDERKAESEPRVWDEWEQHDVSKISDALKESETRNGIRVYNFTLKDDTSDGIKPLEWFEARIDDTIVELRTFNNLVQIKDHIIAKAYHRLQVQAGYRYKDQP